MHTTQPPRSKRYRFKAALSACLLWLSFNTAQAAATFNESSGILFIPAVDVDYGQAAFSVTLRLAKAPKLPQVGDEFIFAGATPNATLGLHNVTFTSINGLAYFPEMLLTTTQGSFSYRMLLQYIPDSDPARLKVITAQAAATFNESSGILFIPALDVDYGQAAFSVTLRLANAPKLPQVGDEFIFAGATPNATLGLHNVTFTSINGLAYFPEMLLTTTQGSFNYRMLLQYIPDSNPARLKVISMAQNDAATYDLASGELHIPLVDINQGLDSLDVLLKRADGKTGLFQEGDLFETAGISHASQQLFDTAYDGSTDAAYVGQVLINDQGRILNYRIRLQGIEPQEATVWRGKITRMALNGSDGIPGPQGGKGDPGLAGLDGNSLLNGKGAPATTLGKNGDFYIDTSKNTLYGPKTNNIWTVATNLVGPAGASGANGYNSLVKVTSEAVGANCPAGGNKIDNGLDTSNNGSLEAAEITATYYVCNGVAGTSGADGTNGTNGLNSLVNSSAEAAGTNCANGGQKVESGLDDNGDGTLAADEVDSTSYVCNGTDGANGADGTNGLNSLVNSSDEPAGTNCANGGQKVESGLDNDGSGTLTADEVVSTSYVCNGT